MPKEKPELSDAIKKMSGKLKEKTQLMVQNLQ